MYTKFLWGVLFVTLLSTVIESRRVNAKPAVADIEDDAVPQQTTDDEQPQQFIKPVLVSRRPSRPLTDVDMERQSVVVVRQSPRLLQRAREQEQTEDEEPEQPQVIIRQQPTKSVQHQRPQQQLIQQRLKEQPQQQKEPTAQTIRNYNKLNDDGSFTFGYEADDGSFKEETRGTDCVVRGKYGYIDPDGNKREFSYVQGNPCDPNAISNEDEEEQPGKSNEEENIPANRPNVPVNVPRPKPKKNRPTTTLFQQTFGDFEQPQPQSQPQPQPQPQLQLQSSTTPRQPGRQQLQQDAPRRPPQISPSVNGFSSTVAPTQLRPTPGVENLESAIRNLPQPSGKAQQVSAGPNSPLYTTELVFDPATGQYNTVIFQQVPKQSAGNNNQRLPLAPARQPQPQFQPHSPPQFQPQPQPQFRPTLQPFQPQFQQQRPAEFDFQRPVAFPSPSTPTASPQQQLIQQQQSLMFQQSQNLFRQQQQQKQQQLQQPQFQSQSSQIFPAPPSQRFATGPPQFTAGPSQFSTGPSQFSTGPSQFAPLPKQQRFEQQPEAHQQQFVLVQPGRTPGQQSLAAGQIDAFLRGHNVQF